MARRNSLPEGVIVDAKYRSEENGAMMLNPHGTLRDVYYAQTAGGSDASDVFRFQSSFKALSRSPGDWMLEDRKLLIYMCNAPDQLYPIEWRE